MVVSSGFSTLRPWMAPGKEPAAGQVESQRQSGGLGDPNARTGCYGPVLCDELPERRVSSEEDWRGFMAEVDAIQGTGNGQCLAELARAVGQLMRVLHVPVLPHLLDAQRGFDRSNQHRFAMTCGPANRVDAKVTAINEVNVSVARFPKQRAVAWGRPDITVASGVIHQVSFCFHNRAARQAFRGVPQQQVPQ